MRIVASLLAIAFVATATAQIPLLNADIENNSGGLFGPIDDWGPNGGVADHVGFAKPGNETLGDYFGYMSVNGGETVGQLTDVLIQPDTLYTFASFAQGGGDNTGRVYYEIGYADDLAEFVTLATSFYDVGETWAQQPGVEYTTGATGDELGRQLWVRLGAGDGSDYGDLWFDSFVATPEPASLGLLGLGLFVALRRRG